MTIQEFIDLNQLEMTCTKIRRNPNMTDNLGMTHWDCEIRQVGRGNRKTLETYYSMGSAHTGAPKLVDVLDCLISDSEAQGQSFENWCDSFGYDSDSRSAYRTYEACAKIGRDLCDFLGNSAYMQLVGCDRL